MSFNFEFIAMSKHSLPKKKKKRKKNENPGTRLIQGGLYIPCGKTETKEKSQQGDGTCNIWQLAH